MGEDDKVVWAGWSRMATPIVSFTITEVRKPNVGEVKPAAVTAELVLDTRAMRLDTKRDWDTLKQHDVLFLLGVQPPSDKATAVMRDGDAAVSVPERYGLQRVRGCEVVEMRDEEGNLVNDFTGARAFCHARLCFCAVTALSRSSRCRSEEHSMRMFTGPELLCCEEPCREVRWIQVKAYRSHARGMFTGPPAMISHQVIVYAT